MTREEELSSIAIQLNKLSNTYPDSLITVYVDGKFTQLKAGYLRSFTVDSNRQLVIDARLYRNED